MKKKQRQQTSILKPENFELETLGKKIYKSQDKKCTLTTGRHRWGLLDYFKLVPALLMSV